MNRKELKEDIVELRSTVKIELASIAWELNSELEG